MSDDESQADMERKAPWALFHSDKAKFPSPINPSATPRRTTPYGWSRSKTSPNWTGMCGIAAQHAAITPSRAYLFVVI